MMFVASHCSAAEVGQGPPRVRARVEHVFADQENGMGGIFVRTIGMARAAAKIGMMNLVYNMRRFVWLERAAAPG